MNVKELIEGNCENCGEDYKFEADLEKLVYCPKCRYATANWDTVEYSQYSTLVSINK